jgi:hypothetical protein
MEPMWFLSAFLRDSRSFSTIQNYIEAPHLGFLWTFSVSRHHPLCFLSTCKISTSPSTKIINLSLHTDFLWLIASCMQCVVCSECCYTITLVSLLQILSSKFLEILATTYRISPSIVGDSPEGPLKTGGILPKTCKKQKQNAPLN